MSPPIGCGAPSSAPAPSPPPSRPLRGLAAATMSLAAISLLSARSTPPISPPSAGPFIDPATAPFTEFRLLPGVGPRLAERIDAYRGEHGPLRSPEDLLGVHGIGPATLRAIEPWLRFEDERRPASEPADGD
jgi:competence protein ComEA